MTAYLEQFFAGLHGIWDTTFGIFGLEDALDILIMAYLIYHGVKLVRETRAAQLVKGIGIMFLFYFISRLLKLKMLSFLMDNVLQAGLFAMVVVFQPELRRALEQVGRSRISKLPMFSSGLSEQEQQNRWTRFIEALLEEAPSLSRQRIGALIVIEMETKLGEIIKTGTIVDADPSAELIGNIFFPNSPLHDGAMIVRDGRIHAAGCFLPLSDNSEISRELGTRHRAALGMSEVSDALVVVVSEETGYLTICHNGHLERGISMEKLHSVLSSALLSEKDGPEKIFDRRKGRKG